MVSGPRGTNSLLAVEDGRLRRLVLDLWRGHVRDPGVPRELLGDALPELGLEAAERRAVALDFYCMLRMRRRTGFVLADAAPPRLDPAQRDLVRYFISLVLAGDLGREAAAALFARVGDVPLDWGALDREEGRIAALEDPVRRFAITHSMPDWVAARFLGEFPADQAAAIAAGLNRSPPVTVRANVLRADRDALQRVLAELGVASSPARFAPHALHLESPFNVYGSQPFRDGWFEQQDESSQLCALLVAPPPHGRVLDACAGAGGKALALAAAMGNRGEILATDPSHPRLEHLVRRRRRAGTDTIRSLQVPRYAWPAEVEAFARRADRILLDVPCSGVGAWRRHPGGRWVVMAEQLPELQATQGMLLERAAAALAPGARLVYATCTVFRDENEDQVRAAVARDPSLELVPVPEVLGRAAADALVDPTRTFLALLPHVHGCDGFFAAVLRRKRTAVARP
jgi:16S rRNA (cytosine967-C5)-methyltransferase